MKVETQELPESQVALSFEVESDRLEQALDAASRRAASRVNIPGFRRGKAPRALVERVIGRESLLQEAIDELLPVVYREAVQEAQIRPLTPPEFEVKSIEPLRATATVVVPPTVQLGDYRGIEIERKEPEVTDEQVEAMIEQLREQHAQWVPTERAAEYGDSATLDVLGTTEGRTVVNREDVEYLLSSESRSPLP
jgi:trigger factor